MAGGFRADVFHTAKTEVVRAGVDLAFAARPDDVAAVLIVKHNEGMPRIRMLKQRPPRDVVPAALEHQRFN
jgi:hypothetical protein